MRTAAQAARIAADTGGTLLPGKPKRDGTPTLSRRVDVGADFEKHRATVEAVSVLFKLLDTDSAGELVEVASGWDLTVAQFEVCWPTDPAKAARVRSHFGARRKAFNWGLARIKNDMDAKALDPQHPSVAWSHGELRKAWNRDKDEVAPWWAENSKETYSSGLADLAEALANWNSSKNGTRKGRAVGFPRFQSARRDPGRVRFTTGTMRLEADRRTITVPVIGALRATENTRRVQRHCASGRAQILNITLTQRWGRLFASIDYALRSPDTARTPRHPTVRAGVDLGMRTLATVATRDSFTGEETLTEYRNPAPLRASLAARRRAGRQVSRRIPGSRGYPAARAKLTKMDRRCVHLRREAAHQLSTALASSYGTIVMETLDIAAMKRGMGRRAFRRSVSDAAMGAVTPMVAYKTAKFGNVLIKADRWLASSQIHYGCTDPDGTPCRLVGKGLIDKHLTCPQTGEVVDRDRNAACNLRDWPDMPVVAQLEPRSRASAVPAEVPETSDQTASSTGGLVSLRKSNPSGSAASSEAKTRAAQAATELRKESA